MYTTRITNPKSGRQVAVKVFEVPYREALEILNEGGARRLSWHLLDQPHSVAAMQATEYGDSAANKFALNVLENALDWSIGLKVIAFIQALPQMGRTTRPKTLRVAVTRGGDVYMVSKDHVILM